MKDNEINNSDMKKRAIKMVATLPTVNHNRIRLYYRFSLLFFWISMMTLIGILAMTFWPYKLLTFQNPVKVLTPVVKAGDAVTLEVHYCKYTNLSAIVSTKIVDDTVTTLPEIATNNPRGCHIIRTQIAIPEFLDPGPHHIERKIVYHPNFFREITIPYNSEVFTVVK